MRSIYLGGEDAPRSPRIFQKRVRRADKGIRPGDVVAVRMKDGRFVGRAFYSPKSVIAARVLDREENGRPVDADWFARRIGAAQALRRDLLRLPEVTNAYRVLHAEGDGLSGLVLDLYADTAVLEVVSRGIFEHLHEIEEVVRSVVGAEHIVVRADADVERIEGFSTTDRRARPRVTEVFEHDLRFHVDCTSGHKTGFFCDQREARRMAAGLARGRSVLDLCCYTGGFALAAARGGATSVTGVDLDEKSLEVARRNARLNGLDVTWVHADTFDHLRTGPQAELVVLDPPKLARSPRQLARARYKSVDFNKLAFAAVAPGGLLFTFSCTGLFSSADFQAHVREAAIKAGREARVLRITSQPPDHPVSLDCPEGRYLTGLLVQVT